MTTASPKGTALITGASTGIGATYADRLARQGYDLILVARDAGRMQTLADTLTAQTGVAVDVLPADLTDRAQLETVIARIASDPAITLLLNNAGMSLNGSLFENDVAAVDTILSLNITAPTLLAQAAGAAFATRGAGTIINIASVLALAPELFEGVYSGTKAYLLNLSLSLANQLRDKGVHVQAVLPGATRTEIWARSGKDVDAMPAGFVMEVGDLVDAALVGLARRETVTMPPLADEALYSAYDAARTAMHPVMSTSNVAPRYRTDPAA